MPNPYSALRPGWAWQRPEPRVPLFIGTATEAPRGAYWCRDMLACRARKAALPPPHVELGWSDEEDFEVDHA
jgi:hypothetical protein